MKRYADGTIEGTPNEISDYERVKETATSSSPEKRKPVIEAMTLNLDEPLSKFPIQPPMGKIRRPYRKLKGKRRYFWRKIFEGVSLHKKIKMLDEMGMSREEIKNEIFHLARKAGIRESTTDLRRKIGQSIGYYFKKLRNRVTE